MSSIPALMQLPIGLGLGAVSVVAPGLLRPFITVALVLAAGQAALLYQAGGIGAVENALGWLIALAREVTLVIVGLGLGRIAASVLVGR